MKWSDSTYGFFLEGGGYSKNYKPEEIVWKLGQANVLIAKEIKIPSVVRTLGVTQVTGVLAPRRADRGRELARANERDTVDIVN